MPHPRKPVWTEGLFMTPQHLQQQDQYHEALVHARMSAALAYNWGIAEVQFDERALAAGQVRVVKAAGVFPDGLPFAVGDLGEDQLDTRPLEGHFPAAIEALDVFLAVPTARDAVSNVGLDPAKAGPMVRYMAQSATVLDVNSGRNELALTWARSHLRLMFGTENRDAFQTVRIAQLTRDRAGAIVFKKAFVPPVLRTGASEHLTEGLRKLLSALIGKQNQLAESRRMRTAAMIDFQGMDASKLWMLHTLNAFIPVVSHMVDHGRTHPEACYSAVASLAGQLCTFVADADPTNLPKFNYLELADVFDPLFEQAIAMISGVIAENYVVIPMEKREDGMYLGKFDDPKVPRTHELFIEARGIEEGALRDRLPRLMKTGSWTQIGYILNAAMPGVRAALEYRPPGAIAVKPGLVFFRFDQSGDYWNDILASGTIAIYQPVEPQKVDLRLIAVQIGK